MAFWAIFQRFWAIMLPTFWVYVELMEEQYKTRLQLDPRETAHVTLVAHGKLGKELMLKRKPSFLWHVHERVTPNQTLM